MRATVRVPLLLLVVLAVGLPGCHGRLKNPTPSSVARAEDAREAAIESYPWPDYVSGEDRVRIENCLTTIVAMGGRDGRDAELSLVELDREATAEEFRVGGRREPII